MTRNQICEARTASPSDSREPVWATKCMDEQRFFALAERDIHTWHFTARQGGQRIKIRSSLGFGSQAGPRTAATGAEHLGRRARPGWGLPASQRQRGSASFVNAYTTTLA